MTDRKAEVKKIYVVMDSDYLIVGVYSTLEMAKKCQAVTKSEHIREHVLDAGDFRLYDAGFVLYQVRFDHMGNTKCERVGQEDVTKTVKPSIAFWTYEEIEITVVLYAKDEKNAVKIARILAQQFVDSDLFEKLRVENSNKLYWAHELSEFTYEELERLHNG